MEILQAVILGIVQGLTEFIPVSSSGHLVLVPFFLDWPQQTLAYDVVLHLGTLLAVLIYFRADLKMLGVGSYELAKKLIDDPGIIVEPVDIGIARVPMLILIATVPAAVAAFVFGDQVSEASSSPLVVAIMLVLVGFVMLIADRVAKRKNERDMDIFDSLIIGGAQVLALIRGTSRSGITIVAGRFLGFSNKTAAKFTFLLSIPVIGLAGAYKTIQLLIEPKGLEAIPMLIGFVTSFVSGLFAISFLMKLFEKKGLGVFAAYRIVLGFLIIVLLIFKG